MVVYLASELIIDNKNNSTENRATSIFLGKFLQDVSFTIEKCIELLNRIDIIFQNTYVYNI